MIKIKINELKAGTFYISPFEITFEHKIIGLIGKNGSGKTTLLKSLGGIIKYNGKITYNDKDLKEERIEYIPPMIEVNYPIKVIDFLQAALDRLKLKAEDRLIIEKTCKKLKILGLLDKDMSKLSSGEIVKVLISKSIITNKKIILWDEPTSFLDIEYKIFLIRLIKKYLYNKTFIIASHDFNWLNKIIEGFIGLKDNKIIFHSRKIENSDIKYLFFNS